MSNLFDQHLTYRQWLVDRGQLAPIPRQCQSCGYYQQPIPARLAVYDTFIDREKGLLAELISTNGYYLAKIYRCSTNEGRVCVDQWQNWQQAQLIVFLGNPSAALVIGEQQFAQQQGKINKLTDNTSYCLTFHPRDILRYQDNAELWHHDLQQTVTA